MEDNTYGSFVVSLFFIIEDKKTIAELLEGGRRDWQKAPIMNYRCVVSLLSTARARAKGGSLSEGWVKKWNVFSPFLLKRKWSPLTICLNEPFALEFCGGRKVRVPEVIRDAVGWSEFCPCAIPVSSNASSPSMSLWMRFLLISKDKNLILNG